MSDSIEFDPSVASKTGAVGKFFDDLRGMSIELKTGAPEGKTFLLNSGDLADGSPSAGVVKSLVALGGVVTVAQTDAE